MTEVELRATSNQLRLASKRQYMDTNVAELNETLTSLTCHMNIVEEITTNWNRMQEELITITTEIAAIRKSQLALTNLMEGISTQLNALSEMDSTQDESLDDETRRLAEDWYSSDYGWSANPMERLATIPEVTSTREEIAPAVITPMISVFTPPVNLPV